MAIIYGVADSEREFLNKLPNQVRTLDDIERVKSDFQNKIKQQGSGLFGKIKKWYYNHQVNKIDDHKGGPLHRGAKGEIKVINELSKLDDSHHIFCGMTIKLDRFVTYKRKRNLRSAQMDLVVVCTKGIFMIEVKNWSNKWAQNHRGLSPHEQTDRAGRVLWIALQGIMKNVRVTSILLSLKGNIQYDKSYRAVFVSSLDRINQFINKRENILSEKEVKRIVQKFWRFMW